MMLSYYKVIALYEKIHKKFTISSILIHIYSLELFLKWRQIVLKEENKYIVFMIDIIKIFILLLERRC